MLARPIGLQVQHQGRSDVLEPTLALSAAGSGPKNGSADSNAYSSTDPPFPTFRMVPRKGELGALAAFGAMETRRQGFLGIVKPTTGKAVSGVSVRGIGEFGRFQLETCPLNNYAGLAACCGLVRVGGGPVAQWLLKPPLFNLVHGTCLI